LNASVVVAARAIRRNIYPYRHTSSRDVKIPGRT
jgi:hypothetical protein